MAMKRKQKQRNKHTPWGRVIIAIVAIILLLAGALVWILNIEHIIQGDWSNVLPVIFVALGVIFALLAWLFPFSPDKPEPLSLPLVRELRRESFQMGDTAAANFPYIMEPIQDAFNTARQALIEASTNRVGAKGGISFLGEANSGKTRLAYEVLTLTLPDWPVLRWMPKPDFTVNQATLSAERLVIFIDDLQNYASAQSGASEGTIITADPRATALSTGLETLRQEVEHVVVVATCRLEDEDQVKAGLGKLYRELMVIPIELDTKDESKVAGYIAEFQSYGSSHIQDWDGTLGSLVLGLSRKNDEYLKIRNKPAATILQAMKLLTRANTLIHTESLLQVVCADVFGEKEFLEEKKKWGDAIELLLEKQFVTEEPDNYSGELTLVIRKETYFEKVVTDYPIPNRPLQIEQDFKELQNVFVKLEESNALFNLGNALFILKRLDEALASYEKAILLDPNLALAYVNKAVALVILKRLDEALEASEKAIQLDPSFTEVLHQK